MAGLVLVDSHIHSDNSPDGEDHVSYICESAAFLGFSAIAITDHCECNLFEQDNYSRSVRQSVYEVLKARAIFKNTIRTLLGIELGQAMQNIPAAEKALGFADFDFVISSLHNIEGQPDFAFMDYRDMDIRQLLTRYYEELLQMVKWGKFDVVGHLAYPLRYIVGEQRLPADMSVAEEAIDEIFRILIQKGKGIEINTSGLRQQLGEPMPSFDYIKRYRDLGGEILTIGSDAHRVGDIGKGVARGMEMAKRAGFAYVTYFEKRRPIFITI